MQDAKPQRFVSHSLLPLLATAGLLLSSGAQAGGTQALAQLEDGSFLAGASGQRYVRQKQLMTRQCLQLRTQRSLSRETVAVLSNQCDYPVVVSYCVDSAAAVLHRCDAIRAPSTDSHLLAPRASLAIQSGLPISADYPVNYLACRATPGAISTLTAARHGECLSPDAHLASARR